MAPALAYLGRPDGLQIRLKMRLHLTHVHFAFVTLGVGPTQSHWVQPADAGWADHVGGTDATRLNEAATGSLRNGLRGCYGTVKVFLLSVETIKTPQFLLLFSGARICNFLLSKRSRKPFRR